MNESPVDVVTAYRLGNVAGTFKVLPEKLFHGDGGATFALTGDRVTICPPNGPETTLPLADLLAFADGLRAEAP